MSPTLLDMQSVDNDCLFTQPDLAVDVLYNGTAVRGLFKDGQSSAAVAGMHSARIGLDSSADYAELTVRKSSVPVVTKGDSVVVNSITYATERRLGGGLFNHLLLIRKHQAPALKRVLR